MAAWTRSSLAGAVVADPFACPERYVGDVAKLVHRWAIDVILPGHEDALALHEFRDVLPAGVHIASPSLEHLELAVSKAAMTQAAENAGVPVPHSIYPENADEAVAAALEIGFPVVDKARRSNGGKGVVLVHSDTEVAEALAGPLRAVTVRAETVPFVQEFLPGVVVGGAFFAHDGTVTASIGERYVRTKDGRFGTSVYRERLDSPDIAAVANRLSAALSWSGIAHVDLIEDPARKNCASSNSTRAPGVRFTFRGSMDTPSVRPLSHLHWARAISASTSHKPSDHRSAASGSSAKASVRTSSCENPGSLRWSTRSEKRLGVSPRPLRTISIGWSLGCLSPRPRVTPAPSSLIGETSTLRHMGCSVSRNSLVLELQCSFG